MRILKCLLFGLLVLSTCQRKSSSNEELSNEQAQATSNESISQTFSIDTSIEHRISLGTLIVEFPVAFTDIVNILVNITINPAFSYPDATPVTQSVNIEILDQNSLPISALLQSYTVTFTEVATYSTEQNLLPVGWNLSTNTVADTATVLTDADITEGENQSLVVQVNIPNVEFMIVEPNQESNAVPVHRFHLIAFNSIAPADPIHIFNDDQNRWFQESFNDTTGENFGSTSSASIAVDKNGKVHACWSGDHGLNQDRTFYSNTFSSFVEFNDVHTNTLTTNNFCAITTNSEARANLAHSSEISYGTQFKNILLSDVDISQQMYHNDAIGAHLSLSLALGPTDSEIWAVVTRSRPVGFYNPTEHITVLKSTDGGTNWSMFPSNDHFYYAAECSSKNADIAVNPSGVATVVFNCFYVPSKVYIAQSPDFTRVEVSSGSASEKPSIAAHSDGSFHIIYERDGGLFYRRLDGATLTDEIEVETGLATIRTPQISVSNDGLVYVFYVDPTNPSLIYRTIQSAVVSEATTAIETITGGAHLGYGVGHIGVVGRNNFNNP